MSNALKSSFQTESSSTASYSLIFSLIVFLEDIFRKYSIITLREERRLRVFQNRVLRRVFGPKREEVTG